MAKAALAEYQNIGADFKPDGLEHVTLYWARMHPDNIAGKVILHTDYDAAVHIKEDGLVYTLIVCGQIKGGCSSTKQTDISKIESELNALVEQYKPKSRRCFKLV